VGVEIPNEAFIYLFVAIFARSLMTYPKERYEKDFGED
jgi:hypothetical protein